MPPNKHVLISACCNDCLLFCPQAKDVTKAASLNLAAAVLKPPLPLLPHRDPNTLVCSLVLFRCFYLQAKDVKKAASLNLAAAALKQQNWGEAIKQATRVLEVDPGNVKALYRWVGGLA